jgi:AmiR/NasT family two-component response regulator
MRVLVCDDEALARDRLVRLLRDAKECEVVGEAENGRDALQKVEILTPDVVLPVPKNWRVYLILLRLFLLRLLTNMR